MIVNLLCIIKMDKDKIIADLQEQVKKKQLEIDRLKEEKELLFGISLKAAKDRLQEERDLAD